MPICSWCGQDSQSATTCEWCKRPIDAEQATRSRSDIEFLRDEDPGRPMAFRTAAVVTCAVACGVLLFFLLRPAPANEAQFDAQAAFPKAEAVDIPKPSGPTYRPPAARPQATPVADRFNYKGPITNAYRAPTPQREGSIADVRSYPSVVKLDKVVLTIVSMQDGSKRIMGKADLANGSNVNVIDYRFELVWGPQSYSANPLTGRRGQLHKVENRVLKAGQRTSVQVLSQPIKNAPGGSPNSIRLVAWLDGKPDISLDDYPIQLGR